MFGFFFFGEIGNQLISKLIDRAVPDPTLDDDNQSDSDEYEYEVIEEIEEVEVDTDELEHADDEPEINTKSHSKHLTISEGRNSVRILLKKYLLNKTIAFPVETITAHNIGDSIKKSQETHFVKKDGSTEQVKVNRALTSQEESILLPLIQGLIAAGEKSPTKDSKSPNSVNGAQKTTNVERKTKSMLDYKV